MRVLSRLAAAGAATAAAVLLTAAPASAHAAGGPKPTNYQSRLTGLAPATSGIDVALIELGRRIRLQNRTGADVVVVGYQGEPYLRVGPGGTFENTRSPSLYQNRTSSAGGSVAVPSTASATAPPEWRRVSSGHTVTWADHRTRVSGAAPAAVRAAPDSTQVVVPQWSIPLKVDQSDVQVLGTITWVPGSSPWPWLAAAAVMAAAVIGLARLRSWGPVLSAVVAVLLAVDVVHAAGLAADSSRGAADTVVRLLGGSFLSIGAWAAGVAAIVGLQRGKEGGLFAACFSGAVIAVLSGFTDLTVLSRSQLPVDLPVAYARSAVAVALGLGTGLVVGAGIRMVKAVPAAAIAERAGRAG